jgi:hypothetical protein
VDVPKPALIVFHVPLTEAYIAALRKSPLPRSAALPGGEQED